MSNQVNHNKATHSWLKKLALLAGVVSATTLITMPIAARVFYSQRLFQPQYRGVYRTSQKDVFRTLVERDSNFANLAAELKEAGLDEVLAQQEEGVYFTVFAPNDEAFKALSEEDFTKFSQSDKRLEVLKYHIVEGEVTPERLSQGELVTMGGKSLQVTVIDDQKVMVGDQHVEVKDPSTFVKNGVIIELEQVLLPADF